MFSFIAVASNLPPVGFDLSNLASQLISRLGGLIALVLGGIVLLIIVRNGTKWAIKGSKESSPSRVDLYREYIFARNRYYAARRSFSRRNYYRRRYARSAYYSRRRFYHY